VYFQFSYNELMKINCNS